MLCDPLFSRLQLQTHNNFIAFDRLTFISEYINPFYKQLLQTRLNAGRTHKLYAESIFQDDFLRAVCAGLKIAPENQTLPKDKLNLIKKEIADIIAFMKALTDRTVKEYK